MRPFIGLLALYMTLFVSCVTAWESHPADTAYDENGDMRFDSEHVMLTAMAMGNANVFDFLSISNDQNLKEVCATTRDFNAPALGWNSLKSRIYCPANFAELPDFFHNMEDYINQGKACPPYEAWDVKQCHSFEHFMGALNSSHFPPQTSQNYIRYHAIAQAVTEHSNALHDKLSLADALSQYRPYWEQCKLEALTYESIGQHYLQDQWAMGHMWRRWGGPDVSDFELNGPFGVLKDYPLAHIAFGTAVGAVSGMIHGWKSTVDPIEWFHEQNLVDDAMSHHQEGVEWVRSDYSALFSGMGDLYWNQEGNFIQQKYELAECSEEGFRHIRSFQDNPSSINPLCWENFATNRAINVGFNYSASTFGSLGVLVATEALGNADPYQLIGIKGVGRELLNLALTIQAAAFFHPYDTYIAEGYTSRKRDTRLTLFGVKPNDEYAEVSSYIDPARTAPGDPANLNGVKPDNDLFGVRQVKYFNQCHANLYCEDASIIQSHKQKCLSDASEVDCQICEELGARFFLGDPPICGILSPGVTPETNPELVPETSEAVSTWCRIENEPDDQPDPELENCPATFDSQYSDNNTRIYTINVVDSDGDGEPESNMVCQYYSRDGGQLYVQTPQVNGEKHGLVSSYFESGGKWRETNYLNGKADGISRGYYESGNLNYVQQYAEGLKTGVGYSYWDDGDTVLTETPYNSAGEIHGVKKQYNEEGVLEFSTDYDNGRKHGEDKVFFSDGSLKSCRVYIQGDFDRFCTEE